jgi:hypothetical protein
MNDEKRSPESADERRSQTGKRPYVKPAFVREQVFETMALACGKINTGPACAAVKKNS